MAILTMVEELITKLDLSRLQNKITGIYSDSADLEKRFHFLENRAKMVQDVVMRRLANVERQTGRPGKVPVIKKRNPLLDSRDTKHMLAHEGLASRHPENL